MQIKHADTTNEISIPDRLVSKLTVTSCGTVSAVNRVLVETVVLLAEANEVRGGTQNLGTVIGRGQSWLI